MDMQANQQTVPVPSMADPLVASRQVHLQSHQQVLLRLGLVVLAERLHLSRRRAPAGCRRMP